MDDDYEQFVGSPMTTKVGDLVEAAPEGEEEELTIQQPAFVLDWNEDEEAEEAEAEEEVKPHVVVEVTRRSSSGVKKPRLEGEEEEEASGMTKEELFLAKQERIKTITELHGTLRGGTSSSSQ